MQGACARAIADGKINVRITVMAENLMDDATYHTAQRVKLDRVGSTMYEVLATHHARTEPLEHGSDPPDTPMRQYRGRVGTSRAEKCPLCLQEGDSLEHWRWGCSSPLAQAQRVAVDVATAEAAARSGEDLWFLPKLRSAYPGADNTPDMLPGDYLREAQTPEPDHVDMALLRAEAGLGDLPPQHQRAVESFLRRAGSAAAPYGRAEGAESGGAGRSGPMVQLLPQQVRARCCPGYEEYVMQVPALYMIMAMAQGRGGDGAPALLTQGAAAGAEKPAATPASSS